MKFWAHRGCSTEYPENTLPAFEAACKCEGLTGIELDIQLTKDGKIVVFHDENVSRTTDGDKRINEYDLEELKKLRIFAGMEGNEKQYTAVPTIEEVLTLVKPYCLRKGLLVNIELKNNRIRHEGMEQKILDTVVDYGLEDYVLYSSFNYESLRLLKELNPEVKMGFLSYHLEECINASNTIKLDALHPWIETIEERFMQLTKGLPVRAWNNVEPLFPREAVIEKLDIEGLTEKGITDLITNVPYLYLS